MRNVFIFMTFLFSTLLSFSQESPTIMTKDGKKWFCFDRKHAEYLYKLVQVNEVINRDRMECDTLVLSLDKENSLLRNRVVVSDSVIYVLRKGSVLRDSAIANQAEQIRNMSSAIKIHSDKVGELEKETYDLDEKLRKERPKKFWMGFGGFVVGVCTVLVFVL